MYILYRLGTYLPFYHFYQDDTIFILYLYVRYVSNIMFYAYCHYSIIFYYQFYGAYIRW